MLGKLKGTIDEILEDSVLLDVGGVGYLVYCTQFTISSLTHNSSAALYIQMIVREDNITLFGFKLLEEKQWFNLLQTVQGVGAKMAIAILGSIDVNKIQAAIAAQDQAAFKSISGIGPKLASRIINELKNKKEIFVNQSYAVQAVRSKDIDYEKSNNIVNDAVSALTNLGFTRSDAFIAVSKLREANDNVELSELIRLALAKLTT